MRVALISPYSWSYPGGVTRHIESLARTLLASGHDVRVFSPVDPLDDLAARMHRGQRPQEVSLPEWLMPLGRTVGLPFNGAISTLALHPNVGARLHAGLAAFQPDVVHVHEPMAPFAGWAATRWRAAPVVGTFHAYATNPFTNHLGNAVGAWRRFNRLQTRIAVSEAAKWTGERFFGGTWTIVPNGVDLDPIAVPRVAPADKPLRVAFIGQAVERKGLGILLPAFEAVRDEVGAELRIVGAAQSDLDDIVVDPRGIVALGKVDDETKRKELRRADVLAAPSLGGESFGMVLTEAFASATPVVASNIAGYRDVVTDGVDGVLVPRGDAVALAETLRALALDPARRTQLAIGAAASADRFAWPHVAEELTGVYEDARRPAPAISPMRRRAIRASMATADGLPTVRPRRLPRPEPEGASVRPRERVAAIVRRVAIASVLGIMAWAGWHAVQKIGIASIAESLVNSSPAWVVAALAVMCVSMGFRAGAWKSTLHAALPHTDIGHRLVLRATSIGVLMSATLPARLGEPSRALVVARRLGRPRETLPIVAGTIMSQTILNLAALAILGAITLTTTRTFTISSGLVLTAIVPIAGALVIVALPMLTRARSGQAREGGGTMRSVRAALLKIRGGLQVFRSRRHGPAAAGYQFGAWILQWLSCYMLILALGVPVHHPAVAAAAVLFAVNVTAIVPVTPSNIGTFQFACVAVLGAYGLGRADALAYGVALQVIEIATAFVMGVPALLREGVSWRSMRLRAIYAAPVQLPPLRPRAASGTANVPQRASA